MPYFLLTAVCSSKFRFAPWTVALSSPKLTAGRGTRIGAVTEFRIPIAPALRCQVEDVVNRAHQVEAALLDVFRQRWVSGVKVAKNAVLVSSEDRHRRVLVSLAIFAAQIILEGVRARTQQPQSVPISGASMCSQCCGIGCGYDRQIDVLDQVVGDTIEPVDQ